ncbi:AT-rich interactive domain-containing protein 1A [Rhynchospora pubera]|uniref:AT-rich interactive domain-containing protein 1A n=1 Tax=Rhynchospora pubera TaxID=906938 RepID=A0AAV8BRX1_9POAL|nr:AT-rich interactive domain-containing protein 1A [Rhynchospora pubera]
MVLTAAVNPRLIPRCPFPSFHRSNSTSSPLHHNPQSYLDNKFSFTRKDYYGRIVLLPPQAVISTGSREVQMSDPELRLVLELASHRELLEIESILFGTSYFSPLLKSISKKPDSYYPVDLDDMEEREMFISHLESRFLFLAADARSVIRGRRPSYRSVLLGVRKRLGVCCSGKLATEDLELEIFVHLLSEYSSEESNSSSLEAGISKWKVLRNAALKVGAEGLKKLFFMGSGALTVEKISGMLAKILSGKLLVEAANYEMKKELIKRGGQLAAINLEARAGYLAARQGLAHAATRYLGLRNLMMLIGPLMWGTLLADVVIQMLGTDYARIVRAIYAFAQIRLTRTNFWRHEM